jgi:large subunit ribosomal protein L6
MSRIGKLPITIPENVDVNYNESEIIVKGKFGTLQTKIPDILDYTRMNNQVKVNLKEETRNDRSLHGLYRTLINNMVIGVSNNLN